MFVKRLDTGILQSNCYIVAAVGEATGGCSAMGATAGEGAGMGEAAGGCSSMGEAAVIDPGVEPREVLKILEENKLTLKYIILTHAHIDHIVQVGELQDLCGGKVVIHEKDALLLTDEVLNGSVMFGSDKRFREADILVKDGDTLEIGSGLNGDNIRKPDGIQEYMGVRLEFIHTPGHTPGSMCIMATELMTEEADGGVLASEVAAGARTVAGAGTVAGARTVTGAETVAGAGAGASACCLFTGDTLFRRGVGRTDLGAGDSRQLAKSLNRLMELQDELTVYPGHGPATSIGYERKVLGF